MWFESTVLSLESFPERSTVIEEKGWYGSLGKPGAMLSTEQNQKVGRKQVFDNSQNKLHNKRLQTHCQAVPLQ